MPTVFARVQCHCFLCILRFLLARAYPNESCRMSMLPGDRLKEYGRQTKPLLRYHTNNTQQLFTRML